MIMNQTHLQRQSLQLPQAALAYYRPGVLNLFKHVAQSIKKQEGPW